MVCAKIIEGQKICGVEHRKYIQKVLLINREDVEKYTFDEYGLDFNLKNNRSGFSFENNNRAFTHRAGFLSSVEWVDRYLHFVTFILKGTEAKKIIPTLILSDCFAVVKFSDETIEVYGFWNGLRLNSSDYDLQNNSGVVAIRLESIIEEAFPPYNFIGDSSLFDKDFEEIFTFINEENIIFTNEDSDLWIK